MVICGVCYLAKNVSMDKDIFLLKNCFENKLFSVSESPNYIDYCICFCFLNELNALNFKLGITHFKKASCNIVVYENRTCEITLWDIDTDFIWFGKAIPCTESLDKYFLAIRNKDDWFISFNIYHVDSGFYDKVIVALQKDDFASFSITASSDIPE